MCILSLLVAFSTLGKADMAKPPPLHHSSISGHGGLGNSETLRFLARQ